MERMEMEHDSSQRSQTGWSEILFNRRTLRTLIFSFATIITLKALWSFSFQSYLPTTSPSGFYLQQGSFQSVDLGGFANSADLDTSQCEEVRHDGQIGLQRSFHSNTNLRDIVMQFQHHPMIVYQKQQHELTTEEITTKCWSEAAGSSVWLSKEKAYLAVTRIAFHLPDDRDRPIISFLRGQLYDANSVELRGRAIAWKGRSIPFPTIFNITTPYKNTDVGFGPEDPQIAVEENVEGAEPVITFSMLADLENPQRVLYLYRPFTNDLTPLTMYGQTVRAVSEKSWAPFFYQQSPSSGVLQQKWPTNDIYFVQNYARLEVIRCHLLNGQCEWLYEVNVPEQLAANHTSPRGSVEGGTNLIPIPIKGARGATAYVGFMHSHADVGCAQGPIYSPQLVVMTASSDAHFHLDFVSDPVDFRLAVLSDEAIADPCGQGRTIIAKSISRWDRSARQDIMTVTLSVDGSTLQSVRVHGILNYVKQLPHLQQSLRYDVKAEQQIMWDLRWSVMGKEILTCALESAHEYSAQLAGTTNNDVLENEIQDT